MDFADNVHRFCAPEKLEKREAHSQQKQTASPLDELTPREREIVQLVAGGRTSKEISAALSLSPKTIEAHRASILKKLNLRSASQMVLHAVRNNIIQA